MVKTRAPKITETQEHAAVAAYFRKVGLGGGAVALHIRNERPGDWQRINARKMGVMPGVPDWLILHDGEAGFIELKPRGWRARKQKTDKFTAHELRQQATHEKLLEAGCWLAICETLDEVKDALAEVGIPLRTESLTTERIKRGVAKAIAEVTE